MNRISKKFHIFAYICGGAILHIALLSPWNSEVSIDLLGYARIFLFIALPGLGLMYWGWKSQHDTERQIGLLEKIFRWLVIVIATIIILSALFAFFTFTLLFLVGSG